MFKRLKSNWTRTGTWFVFLLLAGFAGHWLFKHSSGPNYQGHNMEWWLDYANKTGPDGIPLEGHDQQVSPRREQCIEAFQTFGDPGVEFLCTEAYRSGRTNLIATSVQRVINLIPWSKRRNFRQEAINKSSAASYLLSTMGISYEQAEMLAKSKLRSSNPDTRNSVIWIYHLVTNRQDLIAEKTVPFLTHADAGPRFWAVKAMKNIRPEQARICYPGLVDPVHLNIKNSEYFHILAKYASDSPEIKQRLIELKSSPEPRLAIQVHLALVHGYPEETSHQERLIELVKTDVESSHTRCLDILRAWPYSISTLHQVLTELVQSSKKPDDYLQMIELLRLRNADLSPFIPKLHLLLTFSPFENEFGFFSVRNRDITAMALLLEQNPKDEKVWAYLEELFGDMLPLFAEKRDKQSKGMINMSKDRARFLQRIAQHNEHAAQLLDNLPLAKERFEEHSFSRIDSLLRKHHLIPLEPMDETP